MIGRLASRLLALPPSYIVWKLRERGARAWRRRIPRRSAPPPTLSASGARASYLRDIPPIDADEARILDALVSKWESARFDLLGSGWQDLSRTGDPGGGLPARHAPIDWHRDAISGHQWPASCWWQDIDFGPPGADIKFPWELGRLQHLPLLARAAAHDPLSARARQCLIAQLLDFIGANPPGWGVQWSSMMDVAIRGANIAVACDLLQAAGQPLDEPSGAMVLDALREHARMVSDHLEWHPLRRNNHYLANICGLAVIAAYLPPDAESDAWLAFAAWQLETETLRQFLPDGGGFEASTAYTLLSAQMAAIATLYINAAKARIDATPRRLHWNLPPALRRLPARPQAVSVAQLDRLAAVRAFLAAIRAPDGSVPLIGDADSGRFLLLAPRYLLLTRDEAVAKYDHLSDGRAGDDEDARWPDDQTDTADSALAALDAVLGNANADVDSRLLAGLRPAGSAHRAAPALASFGSRVAAQSAPATAQTTSIDTAGGCWACCCFPDFGLYVFTTEERLLVIRCGPTGADGTGGHAHSDQLSFTLFANGAWQIRDPGTFTYTADPALRNAYRSATAHNGPRIAGEEPMRLDLGLFVGRPDPAAKCLRADDSGFLGMHHGHGPAIFREVRLGRRAIHIADWSSDGRRPTSVVAALPYSTGYGKALSRRATMGAASPE